MNMSRRRTVFIPDDLTTEILSFLAVKPLMRMRCVSKWWNKLTHDPFFVQMHFKKSARKPHLTVTWKLDSIYKANSVACFPISRLIEKNPSIPGDDNPYYQLIDLFCFWHIIGSCNGLLCLFGNHGNFLCIWNPATTKRLNFYGEFSEFFDTSPGCSCYNFTFGCDNSTGNYKVVALRIKADEGSYKTQVKVFNFGDKSNNYSWRDIQSNFPENLISLAPFKDNSVHLRGTINWLAVPRDFNSETILNVDEFVIVSLDLSTETFTHLLMPRVFDLLPCFVVPTVTVLMDSLCFSHDFQRTHFVIWQMEEFGVQDSWTQLFKISYQYFYSCNLHLKFQMLPLYLFQNGELLLLTDTEDDKAPAFIYNCRDNTVERTTDKISWFMAKEYVESLVRL